METTQIAPELPHITSNCVPLDSVIRKFVDYSYTELVQIIKTQPNDEVKKKRLLELIVRLRNEYIRLYVLSKWSSSAADIGKVIDVFAWLRSTNESYIRAVQLTAGLPDSLLGATLPNPDLITALEVFLDGRPTLTTHNLIKSTISTKKVLETLNELNVILHVKFALVDQLPSNFHDYQIKDGRISIKTKNYEFQISCIDENSPFFIIDFQFNKDTEFIKPTQVSSKLITVLNDSLKRGGFVELDKVLTNYINTLKLYSIHTKLKEIKNVKHIYQSEKYYIKINYWTQSVTFKDSYIEIGFNKKNEIIFNWYRQGVYEKSFNDEIDNKNSLKEFLNKIYKKHSNIALDQITNLNVGKAMLQINLYTGLFYFKNSTIFLNESLKQLNNCGEFSKIDEILDNLRNKLRINEISTILKLNDWNENNSIKLHHLEFKKFSKYFKSETEIYNKPFKFFNRLGWPLNWYLILLVIDDKVHSFIGQIKSVSGLWMIQNTDALTIEEYNYKNSKEIINKVCTKIMISLILKELNPSTEFKLIRDDTIIINTNSFIKIPNCSNLLYLNFKFNLNDNKIKIKLKGKLNMELNLQDFNIDKNGLFEIVEVAGFNDDFLLNSIKIKLNKLVKIIGLVNFLKFENLNLINVKLDEIVFKYGSQTCILRNNQDIELPKDNPHNLCLFSIKNFLNKKGIGKLFKYLQNSNYLLIKMNELVKQCDLDNNIHSNDKLRYQVTTKNLNYFTIIYYNDMNKENTRQFLQLEIQMNYDSNSKGFNYLIKFNENNSVVKNEFFNNKNEFIKNLTTLTNSIALGDGLICDDSSITTIVDQIHKKIMTLI